MLLRAAPAATLVVLLLALPQASARSLAASGPQKKPEFVFSNDLLAKAAQTAPKGPVPPLPAPTKGGRAGARKVPPEEIGCLNNVAPAPLNWKMWCAGENATVAEYVDGAGAEHKIITFKPQPGMTAEMALFYQSGAFPQNVMLNGKSFFWYHLWHPIDHIFSENRVEPQLSDPLNPKVTTLIHEAYRNDPGPVALSTKMWVDVVDTRRNLVANRTLAALSYGGIKVWRLLVTYRDTPKGCVVECEYVLGAPEKGWDPANPEDGYEAAAGRKINGETVAAFLAPYRTNDMFKASDKAVTRHTIEEFSNLGKFLPLVWEDPTVVAARRSIMNPLPMVNMMANMPFTGRR